jgi:hypothetical protein
VEEEWLRMAGVKVWGVYKGLFPVRCDGDSDTHEGDHREEAWITGLGYGDHKVEGGDASAMWAFLSGES